MTLRNGGSYAALTQNSVGYWQSKINNAVTSPEVSVEFDWAGTEFALGIRNIIAGATRLWVWIDGIPATAAPVAYADGSSTAGQLYWLRVVFAAATVARVRIWMFNSDFSRISYAPGNHMQPVVASAPRMFMLGDSWIDGAAGVEHWDLSGHLIPRLLGMEGFRGGQGGTGYMNPATSTKRAFTDADRLTRVAAANPDYIYIHGVQNDYAPGTSYTASDVGAAAASVFSQLASLAPNAKLILNPSSNLGVTPPADQEPKRAAVLAAGVAAPNIIGMIDANTDTIYGRGGQ